MGPLGMPEIIVIFVALVLLAIPVAIAIALFFYFNSRGKSTPPPVQPVSVQARLLELDALKAKSLITESEYEEKRRRLIEDI